MFKFSKIALMLIASSMAASQMVYAADVEDSVVVRLTAEEQRPITVGGYQVHLQNVDISGSAKKSANGAPLAAAQGISYYQIYAVYSSNKGTEQPIATYATSTTEDHGGSQLYAYVLQYGYGNPNQANMNGVSKSPASSRLLCGPLSSIHYCSVGETVTGWLYTFDYSGQQSGTFTTSANSTASPFGYWSDTIYIR